MTRRRTHRAAQALSIATLVGAVLTSVVLAQPASEPTTERERLYLDFTEWDYAELGIGILPCDTTNGVGLCLPIVHLFDEATLDACLASADPTSCAQDAVIRSPFIVPELANEAALELADAYRTLRRGLADAADRAINDHSLPPTPGQPCHTPSLCFIGAPPVPDLIVCAPVRAAIGLARDGPALFASYYANVERIITTYLPYSIRSGGPYPLLDSIVSPTMDLTGDLSAFLDGISSIDDVDDAISQAYRMQSLLAFVTGRATPTVPHVLTQLEHEHLRGRSVALPGLYPYEQDKRSRDVLLDPDTVSFGGSWIDGLRTMLPDLIPDVVTNVISDSVADAIMDAIGTSDLLPIIRDTLADLLPDNLSGAVLDDLSTRIADILHGITPSDDVSGLIAYALSNGLALLAPGLFSDDAFIDSFLTTIGLDEVRQRLTSDQPATSDTHTPAHDPTQPISEDGTLRISNPFLYEHIGYAGFTQVTPQTKNVTLLHWNGLVPVPGIRVFCGLGPIKIPLAALRFPAPIPFIIPGVAAADYVTVPEGYPIPHTTRPLTPSPLITILLPHE